MNYSNDSFTSI